MDSGSLAATLALVLTLVANAIGSVLAGALAALRRDRVAELVQQHRLGAGILQRLLDNPAEWAGGRFALRAVPATATLFALLALLASVGALHWALAGVVLVAAMAVLALLDKWLQPLGRRWLAGLTPLAALGLLSVLWIVRPASALARPPRTPEDEDDRRIRELLQETVPSDEPSTSSEGPSELDVREARMIRAILRLEQATAREIMVPRLDVAMADVDSPFDHVVNLMLESGHSRIPVYEEHVDNIVGVVHSRDLLRYLGQPHERPDLRSLLRPALFIPDTMPLDQLLQEFQQRRTQMAIVVDEYGGTEGLVTIEDVLEEVVGEIQDEFDTQEEEIELLGEREAVIDARLPLDQLRDLFQVSISGEGFDTVGGLVYTRLGMIPSPGDEVEVNGLRIRVLSTRGRRIRKLHVMRLDTSSAPSPED